MTAEEIVTAVLLTGGWEQDTPRSSLCSPDRNSAVGFVPDGRVVVWRFCPIEQKYLKVFEVDERRYTAEFVAHQVIEKVTA